jgi:hypothetical protein
MILLRTARWRGLIAGPGTTGSRDYYVRVTASAVLRVQLLSRRATARARCAAEETSIFRGTTLPVPLDDAGADLQRCDDLLGAVAQREEIQNLLLAQLADTFGVFRI